MSPSATQILLEYVCPTLGCFVGNYMFYAPYQDVQKAVARGSIGTLNPLPWAFMLGNCAGWCLYSMLIQNYFVFAGNCPGFFLATWFNLAATKLLYRQQFAPVPSNDQEEEEELQKTYHAPRHDYWVLGIVVAWMTVAAIVGFGRESLSADTKQLIVGLGANLNVIFFYGAPLSTIFTVIRERNTASIHFQTMVTNTANGIFWTAYGFAVLDYYIFVPNGLGSLLGFVQIALYILFPRKKEDEASIVEEANSVDGVEEVKQVKGEDEEAPASGLTARMAEDPSEHITALPAHAENETSSR